MTARDPDATADVPTLASAESLLVLPGFVVIRLIDETPSTRSYDCTSDRAGGPVRMDVLQKDFAAIPARRSRALRDARLVMGMRGNANLARVLEVFDDSAGARIVQEPLGAESLLAQIKRAGPLPVIDALAAVRDTAIALTGAHTAGVVHRDVTPARLFPGADGTLKLTGFGLAAPVEGDGVPENLFCTPAVAAPELVRGAPPDVRSDVYALGATLFWLMTGRPLFAGTPAEVLAAQQKKPVPSIASLVPGAGITVVDILYRLLQKEPSRRPQTAQEVVTLLDAALARLTRESGLPSRTSTPAPVPAPLPTPAISQHAPTAVDMRPAGQVLGMRSEIATPAKTGASPFDNVSGTGDADPYVGQPTGVMGSLKQMSVVDVLQTLEIGKKSARVDVQPMEGEKGTLHVHDGQIVRAVTASKSGEEAVFQLVKKKEGFFRIHYEKEPCEPNVNKPTQFVLLEAMRQIDEDNVPPAPVLVGPGPASSAPPPPAPAPLGPPPLPTLAKPLIKARPLIDAMPLQDPFAPEGEGHWAPPQDPRGRSPDADVDAALEDPTLPQIKTAPPRDTVQAVTRGATAAFGHARDAVLAATHEVRTRAPGWADAAREALEGVRPLLGRIHPRLGRLPLWQIGTAIGTLLMSLGIVLSGLTASAPGRADPDDALSMVLDGDATAALDALERVPLEARTGRDALVIGHARLALGDPDGALSAYADALAGGALDATLLRALVERLAHPQPDAELDLLILWPDAELDDELAAQSAAPSFALRDNTVAVLVERGALWAFDPETVARRDLQDAPACTLRRAALLQLRAIANEEASRAAIEAAGGVDDNECLRADLAGAYAAVARRIKDALLAR